MPGYFFFLISQIQSDVTLDGQKLYEPGSKLVVLGMAIPPLIGNPYNGHINPYYWVDDHPLLYGNNGSLDPSTYIFFIYPWKSNHHF